MAYILLIVLIISTSLTNFFTNMMYPHNLDSKYNQFYRSMKLVITKNYNSKIIYIIIKRLFFNTSSLGLLQNLSHISNSIKMTKY